MIGEYSVEINGSQLLAIVLDQTVMHPQGGTLRDSRERERERETQRERESVYTGCYFKVHTICSAPIVSLCMLYCSLLGA